MLFLMMSLCSAETPFTLCEPMTDKFAMRTCPLEMTAIFSMNWCCPGKRSHKSLQKRRLISLRIMWMRGKRRAIRSSCQVSSASAMTVWLV